MSAELYILYIYIYIYTEHIQKIIPRRLNASHESVLDEAWNRCGEGQSYRGCIFIIRQLTEERREFEFFGWRHVNKYSDQLSYLLGPRRGYIFTAAILCCLDCWYDRWNTKESRIAVIFRLVVSVRIYFSWGWVGPSKHNCRRIVFNG